MATEYVEYNGQYTGEQIDSAIAKVGNLKTVATSGSYNDLTNKPTIPDAANNATLTIKKNGTAVGTFTADADTDVDINITVPTTASDVSALPASTKYAGASTAGGAATSANKLNTNAGSATNPVYFSSGVPVACTYSLEKDVPANAVFTDTTYESKSASSGGTAVSLVTTGEKYSWNNKQSEISDLATIRSGAALGATAVQPETGKGLSTNDFTDADKTTLVSVVDKPGKNLLENKAGTASTGTLTFTENSDGTVTVTGTARTANSDYHMNRSLSLKAGTYVLSGCPAGGDNSTTYKIQISGIGYDTGNGLEFTLSSDTTIAIYIRVWSGYTPDNLTFRPMICTKAEWLISQQYVQNVKTKNYFIPPRTFYCIGNQECDWFHANCLYDDISNYFIRHDDSVGGSTYNSDYDRRHTFVSSTSTNKGGGNVAYQLVRADGSEVPFSVKYSRCAATALANKTVKALFIGDSLIDNGITVTKLKDMFDNDTNNITFTLYGTRGTAPYLHEGRSGWSTYDVLYTDTYNSRTNAFLNPSTGVFDFRYYCEQNSIPTLDYVVVQLGVNDTFRPMNGTSTIDNLELIVNKIKSYMPNVKIGLATPPQPYLGGEYTCTTNRPPERAHLQRLEIAKKIYDKYKDEDSSTNNVYVTPIHAVVDTVYDFTTSTRNANADSTTSVTYCSDTTHYAASGHMKVARQYYCMMKYNGV